MRKNPHNFSHPGYDNVVQGLHAGDEPSIRLLYTMHYRALCYFAEKLIFNQAEAEDIATEVFLKLLNEKHRFNDLEDIRSFLFTCTRNACFDFLRKTKVRRNGARYLAYITNPDEGFGDTEMITAKMLQTIYVEMEALPGQCKKVFKSFFMEGKTTAIIAFEMGISPQTVLNQKTKAIRILRLSLLNEGFFASVLFICSLYIFLKR